MFLHMIVVKSVLNYAHGNTYNLTVYRAEETGDHHIYISKIGSEVGDVYIASEDVVSNAASEGFGDIVEQLLQIATDDIDRNEFGKY